jgi:nucleoside-diphosphate-sugar epimerase
MKILILGGDGFIGSNLLKYHLSNNDECYIIDINNLRTSNDNKKYKFIKFDFSKKSSQNFQKILNKIKPDLIYNCVAVATPSFYVKYPIETFNLDFLVNYEKICLPIIKSKIPLIHFSSSEVYGKKWTEIYKEDSTNLIIGPTKKCRWIYATSKILLEQLLLSHNISELVIIRPQNFCGWDMDWLPSMEINKNKYWIPRLPACYLNALFFDKPLIVVKPGNQKRCYTHINDAVKGIVSIVNHWNKCKNKEIFNIGNPKNEITINNVAKLFIKNWEKIANKKTKGIVFKNGEEIYGNGYEDCERRMFDNSKIFKYTN